MRLRRLLNGHRVLRTENNLVDVTCAKVCAPFQSQVCLFVIRLTLSIDQRHINIRTSFHWRHRFVFLSFSCASNEIISLMLQTLLSFAWKSYGDVDERQSSQDQLIPSLFDVHVEWRRTFSKEHWKLIRCLFTFFSRTIKIVRNMQSKSPMWQRKDVNVPIHHNLNFCKHWVPVRLEKFFSFGKSLDRILVRSMQWKSWKKLV